MKRKDSGPASKDDLAAVESGLKTHIAAVESGLKTHIAAVESGLKADLAAVQSGLKADLAAVEKRLDGKIDGVALELVKTQAVVSRIEANMVTKDDFRRVMAVFDGFAAKLEVYARESITLPHVLDLHGQELRGHETRLGEHDRRLKAVEARP